jgi:hypothetical protein
VNLAGNVGFPDGGQAHREVKLYKANASQWKPTLGLEEAPTVNVFIT